MPDSRAHWPLPLAVAGLSLVAIIATLDSSGAVPQLRQGPGLTLDETFNVQMGVYHVRAIREYGLALFHPESLKEVFGNAAYNPDHPPLGRLLIGIAHELTFPLLNPDVSEGSVCVTCGRFASACGFALSVWLVGFFTTRWHGRGAGLVAAVSLVLMPRLFAHGHIASLETFVNLTYVATVLWVADRWQGTRPPSWGSIIMGGVLFGLCLLTKMQAVLLPVPIAVWTLWRWRMRALLPLFVFGATGLAVFCIGWPWLWLDPLAHLAEYFGRATDRQTLYTWYAGRKWPDAEVPWHYPFVMFAVTVPVGLHLMGILGAAARNAECGTRNAESTDSAPQSACCTGRSAFLLLNVLWPLVFFALPGLTVYDGSRLFLMVFPLWAIFIGRGSGVLYDVLRRRWRPARSWTAMIVLLGAQSYALIALHPVQLSYYNLAVGGLRGAARLGFEITYWGDSITRSFLAAVDRHADSGAIDVAPVLHPFQLQEWQDQSPLLRGAAPLRAFDGLEGARPLVVVFRRRADSWGELSPPPPGSRLLSEVRREGVQLAALYELPQPPPAKSSAR